MSYAHLPDFGGRACVTKSLIAHAGSVYHRKMDMSDVDIVCNETARLVEAARMTPLDDTI